MWCELEADIIRRIFTEFAEGRSPLAIVADLNKEGVPSPRGGARNTSTIIGNRKRANGILNNELYIGRITYNRQTFVKDPQTGKRQARPNPHTAWQTQEVPELRIVVQDLWDAVQARRRQLNLVILTKRQRTKHMLSGLLKCDECGESYILTSRNYLGCSGHRNKRTCTNRRTITMGEVEDRVLSALQCFLLTPEVVAASIEVYRQERRKRAKNLARERAGLS
jgi:hypothetical protein